MYTYVIINTFAKNERGRANWMDENRDIGRCLSRHHSYDTAERAKWRYQRRVQKANAPGAYIPMIVECIADGEKVPNRGDMVQAKQIIGG